MATITGKQLDAEHSADVREWVTNRLDIAQTEAGIVANDLQRAYSAACKAEPVTAMVILPLIEQARAIEQKLAELREVRR